MAKNDNLSTSQSSVDESKSEVESGSLNRRNFLKKSALLSAPVIMTVASGPVWARARNCTLSGRLSGNLSDTGPECPPAACSPGFWKQRQHWASWSSTSPYTKDSYFNTAFGLTLNPAFPGTAKLFQVVNEEVEPNNPSRSCNQLDPLKKALEQLAFHAVAALQNSLALRELGLGYPHSAATVIQKFQDGFAAYNNCDKNGVEAAKDFLELPYKSTHFCPFGNEGTGH